IVMTRSLLFASFTLTVAPLLVGQTANSAPIPPPVAQASPRIAPALPGDPGQAGTQRVYGPSSDTLISRQAADGVLEGFRKAYGKADGAPRVVIYVNRALVDTAHGLKLTDRSEQFEKNGG